MNFAKASIGICNKVLCKILRSPLQTVHRTVCLTLGSNPSVKLRATKKQHPMGAVFLWLRKKDLNPHKQSQSLPCCHYTIPQYSVFRAPRLRLYYYNRQVSSCQLLFRKFLKFFSIIFRHDFSIRHRMIFYVRFSKNIWFF